MIQKHYRSLSAWVLATALLAPSIIARTNHTTLAPTEGVMRVEVTYTEEAHVIDKSKNENGAEQEDVSNFSFRATAGFEQRVTMQTVAGAGINFYSPENPNPKYSGAVAYNGEIKRTGKDEKHRPTLDEASEISFAGVLSEDSAAG